MNRRRAAGNAHRRAPGRRCLLALRRVLRPLRHHAHRVTGGPA